MGLGKAGTTSLFWYLSQHPDICASQVKEVRYFTAALEDEGALPPLPEYTRHFAHCGDQRYVMEASPQYFHGGAPVIDAIERTLERPRLILSLRDPVERMWSHYRFVKSRMGPLPASVGFEEYVARSVAVREERPAPTRENQPFWHMNGSFYAEHIGPWFDAFGQDFRVVFFERLARDPKAVVTDVCGWLGIDEASAASFTYSVENKTERFRSKALQRMALALNRERLLGSRRRLKAPLRKLYYAVNRKAETERMSDQTRAMLRERFAPANRILAEELERRGYSDLPDWLAPGISDRAGRTASDGLSGAR